MLIQFRIVIHFGPGRQTERRKNLRRRRRRPSVVRQSEFGISHDNNKLQKYSCRANNAVSLVYTGPPPPPAQSAAAAAASSEELTTATTTIPHHNRRRRRRPELDVVFTVQCLRQQLFLPRSHAHRFLCPPHTVWFSIVQKLQYRRAFSGKSNHGRIQLNINDPSVMSCDVTRISFSSSAADVIVVFIVRLRTSDP